MLETIINTCYKVTNNAKHITINYNNIEKFANKIENIELKHWLSTSPFGLLEMPIETIINFLLIYESINFSFWGTPKWTITTDEGELDGSIALLYALLKYVQKNNTTDFSGISKEEFREILKGNIEIPLLNERYNIIKNISNIVKDKMNNNFYQYIKDITTDTELFNIIITNFPSFKDERTYNNETIKLYKLAQLLTSDILHIREIKENIKVDYSNLIGCADYKIPQVLRGLELITYSNELASIIDSKQEIEENSIYEVEIRASQLVIINEIKRILKNKECAIDINDYLFLQKNNPNIVLKPYHLTRTTNY